MALLGNKNDCHTLIQYKSRQRMTPLDSRRNGCRGKRRSSCAEGYVSIGAIVPPAEALSRISLAQSSQGTADGFGTATFRAYVGKTIAHLMVVVIDRTRFSISALRSVEVFFFFVHVAPPLGNENANSP